MLPRPSTVTSFQPSPSALRSEWVVNDPSAARRSKLSSPVTIRAPSGSQSMQQPAGFGALAMTSPLPLSSTVRISWAPQFAYQRRPSCQRGDSPTTSPVTSVRSSVILHRLRLRRGPKLSGVEHDPEFHRAGSGYGEMYGRPWGRLHEVLRGVSLEDTVALK